MGNSQAIGIIGSGFSGLNLAYEMTKIGVEVVLVRSSLNESASAISQGVSSIKGHFMPQTELFRAKLLGHWCLMRQILELETQFRIVIERDYGGSWEPFFDVKSRKAIIERAFKDRSAEQYASWNQTKYPNWIGGSPLGSFYYESDFWVNPPSYLKALEHGFLANGGRIMEGAVTKINDAEGAQFRLSMDKHAPINVSDLFVCAGPGLLNLIGNFEMLGLIPVFGTVLHGHARGIPDGTYLMGNKLMRVDGSRFCFGSTSHRGEWGTDPQKLAASDQQRLLESAIFPQIKSANPANLNVTAKWGVRVSNRQRTPLLGRVSVNGLSRKPYLVTGLYKNGMQLSPLIAKVIVNRLKGIEEPNWFKSFMIAG